MYLHYLKRVLIGVAYTALVVAVLGVCSGCSASDDKNSDAASSNLVQKEVPTQETSPGSQTEPLSEKVDKTDLSRVISEQKPMTDAILECFSDETTTVFKEVLESAIRVQDDDSATQEMVDKVCADLTVAADKLEIDFNADDYQSVKWEKLARYPEKYENKPVALKGEVFQYEDGILGEDGTEYAQILMSSDEELSDNTILSIPLERLDGRLLEGDSVTAYGRYDGIYSYETVLGSQASVPSIVVYHIDVDDRP